MTIEIDHKVNRNIAKFLHNLNSKKKANVATLPVKILRENYERFALTNGGPLISLAKIEDLDIDFDDYTLPVRIYTPEINVKLPVIIYFHGGSWHFGSLTSHDVICRHLAKESNSIIIAVDWRLAPEYHFPAPIEDCINIYNWVQKNIDQISGDKDKIIFGGDSAGANIIVASMIRLQNQKVKMPYAHILFYPALNLNFDSESFIKYAHGYFIDIDSNKIFVNHYAPKANLNHPELSPLKVENFNHFPKALIIAAEFDPLVDDGIEYRDKLNAANINVEYKMYPGMIHDFLHFISLASEITPIIKEIGSKIKKLYIEIN
ncbi:MAG: alpha/beta hydrolase [Alphaproteobacteria bacterium]